MECHILLNQFNSFYAVWPKMKFYFLWNSYISFRVSYHIFLYTFLLFRAYFSSKFSIFSCKGRHIRRHCTKACPHFLTRGSLSRVWKYLRRGACTAIFRPPPLPPPSKHTRRISISRSRRARKSPTLFNFGVARSATITLRVLETIVAETFESSSRGNATRSADLLSPLTTWTVNIRYRPRVRAFVGFCRGSLTHARDAPVPRSSPNSRQLPENS